MELAKQSTVFDAFALGVDDCDKEIVAMQIDRAV
jgi:hypothetical protein